jgi:hypothetical protein
MIYQILKNNSNGSGQIRLNSSTNTSGYYYSTNNNSTRSNLYPVNQILLSSTGISIGSYPLRPTNFDEINHLRKTPRDELHLCLVGNNADHNLSLRITNTTADVTFSNGGLSIVYKPKGGLFMRVIEDSTTMFGDGLLPNSNKSIAVPMGSLGNSPRKILIKCNNET